MIGVLPAVPVPYTPYDGPVCADGDPQCIVDVIAEMEHRLAPLAASCDHDAIFSLAYLRVTAEREGRGRHRLLPRPDLADPARRGVRRHLLRHDGHLERRPQERRPQGLADRAGRERRPVDDRPRRLPAQHERAHQQRLPARPGHGRPHRGRRHARHKPDHNAYNQRLDSLYLPVFDEEAARFDPTFDDFDVGPLDDQVVGTIMRGWREMVWRHAENLRHGPDSPLQQGPREHAIEEYAAGQARPDQAIRSPRGDNPPPATPTAPTTAEPHWDVLTREARPALAVVEVSASTRKVIDVPAQQVHDPHPRRGPRRPRRAVVPALREAQGARRPPRHRRGSRGLRGRRLRARLLLGSRGDLLAGAGRLVDLGRLRRWHHPAPVVRRGLQRPHRPHRGRPRRLRPRQGRLRRPRRHVLRGARPHPGHAPGQRHGHPVPLRDLLLDPGAGDGRRAGHRAATSPS